MSFLYWLEQLRHPVLDALFSVITMLGEETLFMAIAMIVFWCVDKKQGYYLFCVGFLGTVCNQCLKMIFRIPRPWVRDPSFTVVPAAVEEATGYSFPSGHTQSSVGLFGGMARWKNPRWLRWVSIALCVLVPFSRLYLGVHTPADVLASVGIALILVFVGYPLFTKMAESSKLMYGILGLLTAAVVGLLLFTTQYPFPASAQTIMHSQEQSLALASAQKNAYTLLGCMLGLLVLFPVERMFIDFPTKAVWWAQLFKVIGGLLVVVAVKELTRAPLEWMIGNVMIARVVRYFLIVTAGGLLWPLTFSWFARFGSKTAE